MDYPGKVIRKTPVTPTQTSASGVWTVDDALQAVKTNTWPIAGVPNPISRSLRFDYFSSAYLDRTPASTSNRRTWTWSGWIKLGTEFGTRRMLFGGGAAFVAQTQPNTYIEITDGNVLGIDQVTATTGTLTIRVRTSAVLRDPSAWYHVIVAVDTTQGTDTNRVKMYINGVQQTSFSSTTYPTSNLDTGVNTTTNHKLGSYVELSAATLYFDGYMAEVNFIDGQQLAASDFGLTDPQTGQWVPKKYTGTYGTNGFYVNFSDNSSTGTLGYDYSGNSNNWTSNNFSVTAGAGNDSLVDVPTPWIAYNTTGDVGGVFRGNYCTLNPTIPALTNQATTAISNGNLNFSVTQANSNFGAALSTVGVSSGKWYFEYLVTNVRNQTGVGFINAANLAGFNGASYGFATPSDGWARASNGYLQTNSTSPITTLSTYTDGDIVICAVDFDAGKMWFGKNGTWDSSGNPGAGTNALATFTPGGKTFLFGVQGWTGSGSINGSVNFGQRPFAYTPPAGFRSLCTTNLPTPTIGATSTTTANKYFDILLWSGTGGARTLSGLGFQPDWVWAKGRSGSATYPHLVWDVLRGTNLNIVPNTTSDEFNAATSSSNGGLGTSTSDGFTIVAGTSTADNLNASSPASTYVGWAWKANGAGSSNTAGSLSSTVSVNATAGFSIVTYTGNISADQTVGHGLGVVPSMILAKSRTGSSTNWVMYHTSLGVNYVLIFQTSAAVNISGYWSTSNPTSTVFGVKGGGYDNNTGNMVAYCFAAVAGYSAFGSYTGNGSSTDGPFIYTGFRPKWVLIKCSSTSAQQWLLLDSARSTYNVMQSTLFPDSNGPEQDNPRLDFLSNGFKIRNNYLNQNTNGDTYVYAAFAEFPFKFSNAR